MLALLFNIVFSISELLISLSKIVLLSSDLADEEKIDELVPNKKLIRKIKILY
tara:strand:+ start:34 stop:192 length:159 start_codon:yes stop_codon:yes gene_type:complete